MRSRRVGSTAAVLAVLTALAVVGGCAVLETDEKAVGEQVVGEHVVRWTQSTSGQEWTGEALVGSDPVMLTTEAERDAWVADLPADADAAGVAADLAGVDLTGSVLVIGGYHRCTEHSRVLLSTDADGPVLRFDVTTDEPEVMCAWSPATFDVWEVPLEATDGVVPRLEPDR